MDESNEEVQDTPDMSLGPVVSNNTPVKNIYLCYYCPKRGKSVNDIQEHWKVTHKNPKFNSEGKITKHALQFQYKIISEEQFLKKSSIKSLFSCENCGKRGSLKALQQHHKSKHPKLSENIVPLTDKPGLKCDICSFFVYSESLMRKHFSQLHPGIAMSFKEAFNDNKTLKKVQIYRCNYCSSTFDSISNIKQHHENLHSHKNLVLNVTDSPRDDTKLMRRLFKCPMCTHSFEAYDDTCQHIETHIKPFSCNYCFDGFSFTDTVKLHIKRVHPDSDISNYSAVPNTKEKIQEAIAQIDTIYKKCDNFFNDTIFSNECKKLKLSGDEILPNSVPIYASTSSVIAQNDVKPIIRAFAKKSTSKLPNKLPTAKKSTSKQNIWNDEMFQSYYKKDVKYDNSGIHTVVSLGGKPMRLSIENLAAITNIHPTLRIVDVKSELNDENLLTNLG